MGKNKLFDIDEIEELTSNKVFERGQEYYENGYVGKIIKKGNTFEGTVKGSYKYKVSLEKIDDDFEFECSCPYDFEGICKHSVAFALAIIDGKYTDDKLKQSINKISPDLFEKKFNSSSTEIKLSFLKQLLEKDSDLQGQFISFIGSKTKQLDKITGVDINKIKKEIFSELSDLDFDDLSEYQEHFHGDWYHDEFDDLCDQADKLIEEVFEKYYKKAETFIRKGNIIDSVRIILGIYEGSQDLPELDSDEYDIFDGQYNDNVALTLRQNIENLSKEISKVIKSDETVFTIIDLIFSRFNFYEKEYKPKNSNYGQKIEYLPEDFDKLFLAIITNEKTASYLYKLIMENDFDCPALAFVILKIAEISNKEQFWIETAERFFEHESEIAQKLLDKYKLEKKENDFNRVAEIAFGIWPDKFNQYLIDNVNKDTQKKLYVNALKHYTSTKHSIKHYKELRNYLSENELKQFLFSISRNYNNLFYIKLLEIEKLYDKILHFVENNTETSEFDKLIEPIINIYSEECYSILKEKCQKAFNSLKRNRDLYHEMTKWLKLMKSITSKKTQATKYISELYNHKPNLPALRDEMKKSGLFI